METNKDEKCYNDFDKYRITVEFLKYEGTMLWQIFNSFFIANTIFIGFVSAFFVKNQSQSINYSLLMISGIIGLMVAFFWLITFTGNSRWYYFRMKQAKKAESNVINGNDSWCLLTKEGEEFARKIKTGSFGLTNKNAGILLISIFIFIYIVLIICSLCYLCCKC